MNVLKEASENLQLYFQLGDTKSFERLNQMMNDYFIEKNEFSKNVTDEIKKMQIENIRVDFVHIANRLYKKEITPKDFESGVIRCENIINSMYNIK